MDDENKPKAVIYCRVSTSIQLNEGGLKQQEDYCRNYAEQEGYEVVNVFRDITSDKWHERTGVADMLYYLGENHSEQLIVLVSDTSRVGRSVPDVYAFRCALQESNAKLECPAFKFSDDGVGPIHGKHSTLKIRIEGLL